jgi:hypothetical protein
VLLHIARSWEAFWALPGLLLALVLFGLLSLSAAFAGCVWWWLVSPSKDGFSPRYLKLLYKNPIKRVSFGFENYLGLRGSAGGAPIASAFSATIKVNRGKGIIPKRAYIQCSHTATFRNVLIDAESTGDRSTFRTAESIQFLPSGHEYRCFAFFENEGTADHNSGMTQEALNSVFYDLTFVFEYDDTDFSLKFSRRAIEKLFRRFRQRLNPAPRPRPTYRDVIEAKTGQLTSETSIQLDTKAAPKFRIIPSRQVEADTSTRIQTEASTIADAVPSTVRQAETAHELSPRAFVLTTALIAVAMLVVLIAIPIGIYLLPPLGISKPTVRLVSSSVQKNDDGTFTTTKVAAVESVFVPPVLIVECFAKDIVRWSVRPIHQIGNVLHPDVDTTTAKSGVFAQPYGAYRIDVVTKQDVPVKCQYGLTGTTDRLQPEGR